MNSSSKHRVSRKRRIHANRRFRTAAEAAEVEMHWMFADASSSSLFHYTGNEGLKGIIESTSLWATNARFLNDRQEVEVAINAARTVVSKYLIGSSLPHAEALGEAIMLEMVLDQSERYIFSLTEDGDSLSQWRGYSNQGAGYSIGFKHEQLTNWCSGKSCSLARVRYGTEDYTKCLSDIAIAYVVELSSYFPYFGVGQINEDVLKFYAKRFTTVAMHYAPFMKHKGFSDEREWRMVMTVNKISQENIAIEYRSGTFSLIPYYVMKWEPKNFFEALSIINIKPSEHTELCDKALRAYVRSEARRHGLSETMTLSTEISGIPFRPGF